MYYSQFGEDQLLETIFKGKTDGTCVEVGANDGVNDSMSYYFEKLGWTCVLVEPNPELCRQIRTVRSATLFECAASDSDGIATLHIAEGEGRAHGVSGLGADEQVKGRIEGYGFSVRSIDVPTARLDKLLEHAGAPLAFDFLSIDVEGHELQVLQGLSLKHWKPRIVIAEDNSRFRDTSVIRYLRDFNYVPFRRTGVNDWFAHTSDTLLVNVRGRLLWHFTALNARLRHRLKAIPGVLATRALVRRLR